MLGRVIVAIADAAVLLIPSFLLTGVVLNIGRVAALITLTGIQYLFRAIFLSG